MVAQLIVSHSWLYARSGVGLVAALLKHSLVPLHLLWRVLPQRGLVLDLGCGEGMLGNLVAAGSPGVHSLGIDLNPEKIAIANRNSAGNASYESGDILERSFSGAAAVILNDVLHHHPFEKQVELLKRVAEFLEKDGVLIVKEVDASDTLDRKWTTFWDSKLYPDDKLHFRDVKT